MHRAWVALLAVVCITISQPLSAQKITGTISGVVTDPSGAVVAKASVSIINGETGLTRNVTTNDSGEYTAPDLPFGMYRVIVKQAGYTQAIVERVDLHVASTALANVTLKMGNVSETVEVVSSDIQVQTESAELGEVVEGQQVRELPLNGRNFVELTQLQPGVSSARTFDAVGKGLKGGVDFAVNGNSMTNNLFLVDGANDNDIGSNRTILIYPSLESIAEFRMLRNAYGPEYGQASGSVINIVTRGGTNQWHGSVFYSGRNDKLNAYDFFSAQNAVIDRQKNTFNPVTNSIYSSPNQDKPILRHNDYGYSLGGPVKKDKLFFFWSQEWNREVRGVFRQGCVPTDAERKGDFSAGSSCGEVVTAIPAAVSTAPGSNIIANPSQAMLDYMGNFPLPNFQSICGLTPVGAAAPNPSTIGCNNWKANLSSHVNWRQENARGDYNLSRSHVVMFRYTQDTWVNPAPVLGYWGDDQFPPLESNWSQPSKSIIGKLTSTIGAHLINTAGFSYSNNRINITPGGTNPNLVKTLTTDFPTLFPSNLKTHQFGEPTINTGKTGNGPGGPPTMIAPWSNGEDLYNFRDDVSWIKHNHTLKFGLFLGFNKKDEDNGGGSSERLSADTRDPNASIKTGDGLANAFIPTNTFGGLGETSTDIRNKMRWRDYELYAGDSWKVSRRLTLDLGLRYSILLTPYQVDGLMTSFHPSLYNPALLASDACNGLWIVPGTNPCTKANGTFGTSFSPGTPGPNKYLKDQNYHQFAPRLGIAYDVFGDGNTAIRAGFGQFYQRDRSAIYIMSSNAPFALSASAYTRSLTGASFSASQFATAAVSPSGGVDPSNLTAYSFQWNVSVEHSFRRDTSVELAYVGNRAVHQLTTADINEVPQSSWTACAFMSSCNSLRPFTNYGFLTWWGHSGDAHYNALQAVAKARLWRGALMNLSYTWSHSIADVPLDESNGSANYQTLNALWKPGLDKGNSQINRPNIFVANLVVPLPELRGSNSFLRGVAGGWQVSTILIAENGPSTTMYQHAIGENKNLLANPSDPNAGKLNSLYGTGNLGPSWDPGSNRRPDVTGVSCNSGSHSNLVYNPAAFSVIGHPIGQIGNEPQGYCHGPSFVDDDLSLQKTWKVTERVNLQFRMDAFNLFNHTNFKPDSSNNAIGSVNCGAANGSGLYQPCSATNNIITASTPVPNSALKQTGIITNNDRELQYGLKITF
jgi:Carboxypeptidase regulatory-like domain